MESGTLNGAGERRQQGIKIPRGPTDQNVAGDVPRRLCTPVSPRYVIHHAHGYKFADASRLQRSANSLHFSPNRSPLHLDIPLPTRTRRRIPKLCDIAEDIPVRLVRDPPGSAKLTPFAEHEEIPVSI